MRIQKKTKRYNFKEEKLELCFSVNVERFTDEQVDNFIRVFARSINISPNRLMPERPSNHEEAKQMLIPPYGKIKRRYQL